ncbi:MAG: hypothetical protein WBO57_03050 [Gammaproteobacteria bacterium]
MELQLPERKKPDSSAFNTNPEAVRKWVEDLPLVNTDRACTLLEDALDEMNTLDIPAQQRLLALEQIATPVMHVTAALNKRFTGKPIPLGGKDLESSTRAIALCDRMATGYKILASDLYHQNKPAAQLATAIHRAMRYLSEVLLVSYQVYTQYPEGLWNDIHSLYDLAEQRHLESRLIVDTGAYTSADKIGVLYKQILLLSLACPYRLRPTEIRLVYNALANWASASELSTADKASASASFAVNLLSDDPPSYRELNTEVAPGRQWRILDTSTMAELMRTAISAQTGTHGEHRDMPDAETMHRLMLTWGVMPKRKFARHSRDAAIKLVIGLNSVHRVLAAPEPEQQHLEEGIEEKISDHEYLQDPTFVGMTTFSVRRHVTTEPASGNNSVQPAASIKSWKQVDMSAGGYCLLGDREAAGSARVGELIATAITDADADADAAGQWQLGVIRRMKVTLAQELELGIQMLSPGAHAIWVWIHRDKSRTMNKLQGISLPEIMAIKQQATLILPSMPFRVGSTVSIDKNGRKEKVELTRQLENTGSFAQYHFGPPTGT